MDKYIVKNNKKSNILINDLPEIPIIGPGESHNLLGCTTIERIKESEQLRYCLEREWLSIIDEEISNNNKEESEEINNKDLNNEDLNSKIDKITKDISKIKKDYNGLSKTINFLKEKTTKLEEILNELLTFYPNEEEKITHDFESYKEKLEILNNQISELENNLENSYKEKKEIEDILFQN